MWTDTVLTVLKDQSSHNTGAAGQHHTGKFSSSCWVLDLPMDIKDTDIRINST